MKPVYRYSILHMAAHTAQSKAAHSVLGPRKINSAQWRILGLLSESKTGNRIADIAGVTFMKSTLVNALVRELLERELVQKVPHPTDKRANLLTLSKQGHELLESIEKEMQARLAELTDGTPDDDFSTYLKVLETIKHNGAHYA